MNRSRHYLATRRGPGRAEAPRGRRARQSAGAAGPCDITCDKDTRCTPPYTRHRHRIRRRPWLASIVIVIDHSGSASSPYEPPRPCASMARPCRGSMIRPAMATAPTRRISANISASIADAAHHTPMPPRSGASAPPPLNPSAHPPAFLAWFSCLRGQTVALSYRGRGTAAGGGDGE